MSLKEDFEELVAKAYISPALEQLVDALEASLKLWDECYVDVLSGFPGTERLTEEKLKVATRNEVRKRGGTLPEIARWRLRAAIGYRSEEGEA